MQIIMQSQDLNVEEFYEWTYNW